MDDKLLRKVQMVQLEIAKEIKRVCDENGLDCFLVGGTLLGAVRHGGFIPWDDDLDLGMSRKDYETFLKIASKALNEKYEVAHWSTDADYPHPMAKVVKKGTIYIEEKRKDSAKQGIWVDIFPIDVAPIDPEAQKKQGKEIMYYRALVRAKCHFQTWHSQGKFIMKKWIKNLPIRMLSAFYSKEKAVQGYETAAQRYMGEPCNMIFENAPFSYESSLRPAECFDELVEIPFEDDYFKAPKNYDLYLSTKYGDYMTPPPESARGNQHSIVEIDLGDGESV